jgi:hypothetical protein
MRSRSAPVRSLVQKRPERRMRGLRSRRAAGGLLAANAADTQTEEAAPVQEGDIAQRSVQDDVAFVDEAELSKQDSVTEVTRRTPPGSGWYVAQGDVIIDHRVAVDVRLCSFWRITAC